MRARGNGEGSIWYREDRQRWVAALTLPDGSRRTKTARTQREAQRWLVEQRARVAQGDNPGKRQRVSDYLTTWLAALKPTIKASSYDRYAGMVRLHIGPALGKQDLSRLSSQAIERYKADKLGAGLAPGTVRMHLSLLSHALSDAVRQGLLLRNPCAAVDAPRKERKVMQVYDEAQGRLFLAAARKDRLEALYALAITTGMRQGEVLALHWEDIDWQAPLVQVRRTMRYQAGAFTFTEPKGGRARAIHLTELAADALRRRQEHQRLERAAAREDWQGWDVLVFTTTRGRPIIPQDLRITFHRFLDRAKLPRIRFHDLRHTVATLMLSAGEHPKVVQETLGHSTATLTMDIYSHVSPTMQAGAMRRLQERLSDPTATPLQPPAENPEQGAKEK